MRKQAFSCGAVVFTGEGPNRRYLLVVEKSGHTGLPKGTMEAGETPLETALREIREETGVNAEIMSDFCHCVRYQPSHDVEKQVEYFLARYENQPIRPMENQVLKVLLLPFEQAMDALTHESTRRILCLANEHLNALDH